MKLNQDSGNFRTSVTSFKSSGEKKVKGKARREAGLGGGAGSEKRRVRNGVCG